MSPSFRRRSLLRLGGAAACSSLAGCATIQAELGLRTERLGDVALANSIDEPFVVNVRVNRNETLVHASSHELARGSSAERVQVVLDEWEGNGGARSWEVEAKTSESEWRNAEIDAAVGSRNDCHDVTVVTGDWPETSLLVLLGDCNETHVGTPTG